MAHQAFDPASLVTSVFAAGELEAVGRGLEELRLDELIQRLEAP